MTSIVIEVSGLDEVRKLLQGEPQNQTEAMIKAQSKVASMATEYLKREGLNNYGGAYGSKSYHGSKKGEMPLKHSGALQASIFYKNLAHKTSVETKFGSLLNPPEYAKYLEGRNGDGIRPFLWFAQKIFNLDKVLEYFDKYYRPLKGI